MTAGATATSRQTRTPDAAGRSWTDRAGPRGAERRAVEPRAPLLARELCRAVTRHSCARKGFAVSGHGSCRVSGQWAYGPPLPVWPGRRPARRHGMKACGPPRLCGQGGEPVRSRGPVGQQPMGLSSCRRARRGPRREGGAKGDKHPFGGRACAGQSPSCRVRLVRPHPFVRPEGRPCGSSPLLAPLAGRPGVVDRHRHRAPAVPHTHALSAPGLPYLARPRRGRARGRTARAGAVAPG